MKPWITTIQLLPFLLIGGLPGSAQQTGTVTIGISLLDPKVCLYEPARFALSLSNPSGREIAIDLGRESEEYITVAMEQSGGQWRGAEPVRSSGFVGGGVVRLKPAQEKSLVFIADKWLGRLPQGVYHLRVSLQIPTTNRDWEPPADLVLAGKIKKEADFDLQVTQPCPGKLKELAEDDFKTIFTSSSVHAQRMAAEHLSFIRDDVAIQYMERAVAQHSIENHYLMDGLVRIGDINAQEALARLSRNDDANIAAYAHYKAVELNKP